MRKQLIISYPKHYCMQEKPIATLIEKIAKECEEANANKWTITRLVKKLSSEEATGIKNLRKRTLEILQQLDPKAATVYASFQRMQVRTSSQLIEGFDRGNIIKSLLRETEVARGVAEKIGNEVEEKIKDLEIEKISTPLIREMVNVKLLEYGHENIRNQYTRLGLPVFEAGKKAEQSPYNNKAIMTEYNLLRIIPNNLGRMHLSKEIFIAEIQDFSTRPIATSLVPEIKESPRETVFELLEKANRLGKFYSWRPNISGLNAAIAAKVGKKTASNAGQLFANVAKTVFLSGKSVSAFNTSYLFEPEFLAGKGIERESMAGAATTMLKANSKESFPVFENAVAIDTKYKLKILHKPFPKTFLNCKNKELFLVNGLALPTGSLCSFTGLNLSLIALENKGNETAFFEEVGKKARVITQLDKLKRKNLLERHYVKKQNIDVDRLGAVVALDSLVEASKAFLETEKEGEALSFSEKIISELKKELSEKFCIVELSNKTALYRFSSHNKKMFKQARKPIEEEKILRKSKAICKNYCFAAKAESQKELNELIDSNIRLIEFKNSE